MPIEIVQMAALYEPVMVVVVASRWFLGLEVGWHGGWMVSRVAVGGKWGMWRWIEGVVGEDYMGKKV